MINWWNGLELAQQVFAIVGIASTVILLIQTIMLIVGLGDNGDADAPDFDVDADDGSSDGSGDGIALFSIRGIVAMLCVTGWMGTFLLGTSMHKALAVIISVLCGFATLVAMAFAMKALSKLQSSGNINIGNAVGKVGQVYIPIKPSGTAAGKVNLTLQGRYSEFPAITTSSETIPTGSYVRVVAVDEAGTLVVEPISKPQDS